MVTDGWVPPAMGPQQFEALTTIESGFPEYLRGQVIDWVMRAAEDSIYPFDENVPRILSLKLKTRFPERQSYFQAFIAEMPDDDLANVIDCMLYFDLGMARSYVRDLAAILEIGLSGWAVTEESGVPRVTQRIPSGVVLAYDTLVSKTALSGQLLAEAFEAAYGATTNPNHCYDLCVKAVETLASHRYIPNNTTRATLGAVISHLEQKAVSLPLIEKNTVHKDALTQLMRVLWEGGQRHGNDGYEHVSLEGARTAHAIAVSLVAMIHEDVISVS